MSTNSTPTTLFNRGRDIARRTRKLSDYNVKQRMKMDRVTASIGELESRGGAMREAMDTLSKSADNNLANAANMRAVTKRVKEVLASVEGEIDRFNESVAAGAEDARG